STIRALGVAGTSEHCRKQSSAAKVAAGRRRSRRSRPAMPLPEPSYAASKGRRLLMPPKPLRPEGLPPVKNKGQELARDVEAESYRRGCPKIDGATAEVSVTGWLPPPGNERSAGEAHNP